MNAQAFPSRHRITVEEYHRMGEAGIFTEDERVELIEGEIIDMAPIGSRHAGIVAKLGHILTRAVGETAIVWIQNPIALGSSSEPEPDVALLRLRQDFYTASLPTGQDVLLVIEVADTSSSYDRSVKVPLYARFGIPEVWLIDLSAGVIEVFRDPSSEGYRSVQQYRPGDTIQPAFLPQLTIEVAAILPSFKGGGR